MAVRWAVATGNWSNPATWDGGTLPGAGDDVYADGKTVTVDVSATVATVRTQQRSGGTAGGVFTLANGVTLTADAIAGTTTCLTLSGTASATLAGNATGGSGSDARGASNNSTGTLTIGLNATGGSGVRAYGAYSDVSGTLTIGLNATGGSGGNAYGAVSTSTGTLTIGLSAIGGSGSSAYGARNTGTGTISIGLDSTGGSGSSAYGASNNSTGTLTIGLNAIGGSGSSAHGVYNGTGTLTVAGRAVGNDKGSLANPHNEAFGVYNQGSVSAWLTAKNVTVGGIEFGQYGQPPAFGRIHFSNPAPAGALGYTPAGVPVPIGAADPLGFPAERDVRLGADYAAGGYTGSLAVPPPSAVLAEVPTDDTVGLLVAEIDTSALTEAVAALDARLAVLDPILPEVPSVAIPAPSQPTATVAWCYCMDANGAPLEDVEIHIRALRGGAGGKSYTQAIASGVSDDTGLVSMEIPRDATLRFSASRGDRGPSVDFAGTAETSLQLPAVLGLP